MFCIEKLMEIQTSFPIIALFVLSDAFRFPIRTVGKHSIVVSMAAISAGKKDSLHPISLCCH